MSVDPFFQPLALASCTLSNRLVMAPMTIGGSPDGLTPEGRSAHYGERAEHDIGLIETKGIGIDHSAAIGDAGAGVDHIPELASAESGRGLRAIVDRVHAAGSLIFPQLWHQGGLRLDFSGRHADARSPRPSGHWGPSDKAVFFNEAYNAQRRERTQPVTEAEIADLISAYRRSAAHAVTSGFDGIAIHGAHGYLIDSFFWRGTSRRSDRRGGDIAGRARFGAEVVRAIRSEIGDRPIMFRFSQWKLHDYDARLVDSPAEFEALLSPLADAGVHIFDASTRRFAAADFGGSNLSLAGWAQKVTGIPTMAVGGVGLSNDLQTSLVTGADYEDNLPQPRRMIADDEIAVIGIGRGLLTDPDWAARVRDGRSLAAFPSPNPSTEDPSVEEPASRGGTRT